MPPKIATKTCHPYDTVARVGHPYLGRTATPVFAPIMENGVESVVPTRGIVVVGYLEVLLAPEVNTAESKDSSRGAQHNESRRTESMAKQQL